MAEHLFELGIFDDDDVAPTIVLGLWDDEDIFDGFALRMQYFLEDLRLAAEELYGRKAATHAVFVKEIERPE